MKKILKKLIVLTYMGFLVLSLATPLHFSIGAPAIVCQAPLVPSPDYASCITPSTGSSYHLLAPLPGLDTDFNATSTNSLGKYLNVMIRLIIGLAAVFAVVMIVIGGIEYMTSELISGKEAGKERIEEALLGLLIALGAYALLNTINPNLLNTNITVDSVTITAEQVDLINTNDNIPQTAVNGKYGAYTAGSNFASDFPQNTLTNLPSGASVYNSQCTTVGQTNCTSTLGLDPAVVNATEAGCKCQLSITGGTEFWLHGGITGNNLGHQPGSATVDLSITPGLTAYIMGGSTTFPNDGRIHPPGGLNGVCYLAEQSGQTANTTASHWHAQKC